MAHTGPDDQSGNDTVSTTGWNWGAGVAIGLSIGVALGVASSLRGRRGGNHLVFMPV